MRMLHGMATQESAQDSAEVVDATLSVKEAAARANVNEYTVRRAHQKGLLKRCNAKGEPPRFNLEVVQDWIAMREGYTEAPTARTSHDEIELAKADALTNLVSQSQGHTEHAWTEARLMVVETRKAMLELLSQARDENARLRVRIDTLEKAKDDVDAALEELRANAYDVEIAKGEAQKNVEKNKTMMDLVKLLAPAAIASILPAGPGKESVRETGMLSFFESLTQEQRDTIMGTLGGVLTADQVTALMLMLSRAEAKKHASEAKSEPKKDETPPPGGG